MFYHLEEGSHKSECIRMNDDDLMKGPFKHSSFVRKYSCFSLFVLWSGVKIALPKIYSNVASSYAWHVLTSRSQMDILDCEQ